MNLVQCCPLILIIYASLTLAQDTNATVQIIPDYLPSCAGQCAPLQNAQAQCSPPSVPQTNNDTVKLCFCQSALLSTDYSKNITFSCPACSELDSAAIQSWYQRFCQGGDGISSNGASQTNGSTTASTGTFSTTLAATASTSASANATPTSSATVAAPATSPQYNGNTGLQPAPKIAVGVVVPIVVLFVGASLLLLYQRRRVRRKARAVQAHGGAAHVDVVPYLQEKAELEDQERRRYQAELEGQERGRRQTELEA